MAEEAKDFGAIGEEILFAARNELYMNLPYLDVALCGLRFAPGDEVTLSIATDGQTLYYSGSWLAERYLRSRVLTNRAYLHVILHDGRHGDPLQAQAAVLLGNFQAVVAAPPGQEAGKGGGAVGPGLRCGGGEYPLGAGLPLPGRGDSAYEAEVFRRVPAGDAGADGRGDLPVFAAAGSRRV